MQIDGITAHFFAKELNENIIGTKIDRVNSEGKHLIQLKLRGNIPNNYEYINISANPSNPYIYLSENKLKSTSPLNNFAQGLRKHLTGGVFTSVSTSNFERVFNFQIKNTNNIGDIQIFALYVEIAGKYVNIVLVDEDSIIIDALNTIYMDTNPDRPILPGHPYSPPPIPDKISPLTVLDTLNNNGNLSDSDFVYALSSMDNSTIDEKNKENDANIADTADTANVANTFIATTDADNNTATTVVTDNVTATDNATDYDDNHIDVDKDKDNYINNYINNNINEDKNIYKNKSLKDTNISISQFLVDNIFGFSPFLSKEILYKGNIDPNSKISDFNNNIDNSINNKISNTNNTNNIKNTRNPLINTLREVLSDIKESNIDPTVFYRDENYKVPIGFHALTVSGYVYKKRFSTVSDALNVYYEYFAEKERLDKEKKRYLDILRKRKKSLIKLIGIHESEVKESLDFELLRIYGENIYSNLHKINKHMTSLKTLNYEENPPTAIEIPLDTNISPSQNAQEYFRQFKKMKTRHGIASDYLYKENKELDSLNDIEKLILSVDNIDDIGIIENAFYKIPSLSSSLRKEHVENTFKKKSTKKVKKRKGEKAGKEIRPRYYISSEGYEIYLGRNSYENNELTFSFAGKNDLWLHGRYYPGPHTILRTKGNTEPSFKAIEEAACLTAHFTEELSAGDEKIEIVYCLAKYVTKQKSSNPGQVNYRNFKSIYVRPAIPEGVIKIEK